MAVVCDCKSNSELSVEIEELKNAIPDISRLLNSIFVLSCVGEQLVAPVFALTDAVGTVMRRKLEPISKPVSENLNILLGK
jgi:hypothetical protein